VFGFVGKPYKPDQLAATVRQALDRSATTDEFAATIGDDRDFR
jgi:DNA-binding NtrC family response regulator